MTFTHVRTGDTVTRMLAGVVPMVLRVTSVTDRLIVCGDWTFDRETGVEEDEEIGWGVKFGHTGSYLVCGRECYTDPVYGFVPEDGCPVHDVDR